MTFMKILLKPTTLSQSSELNLTPASSRCKVDDSASMISMPHGYCYLYTLCDYLHLLDYTSTIPSRAKLMELFFNYCLRDGVKRLIEEEDPELTYLISEIDYASQKPEVDITDEFLGISTYEEYVAFGAKNSSRYVVAENLDGSHHMYVNLKGHLISPTWKDYSSVGKGRGGRRNGGGGQPRRRRNNNNNNNNNGGRRRNQIAQGPKRRQQNQNQNSRANWKKRLAYGATDIATSFLPAWAARPANSMAHAAIDRITGRGDYQIKSAGNNTLKDTGPPSFASPTAVTRVKHREYIGDISSTTAFACTRYVIQPGVSTLFPWLNIIAANFEQYRLMGMVLEFKSTSADALGSTNTALGIVGITTQYDTSEANFTTKAAFENYVGTQSAKPSQSLLHYVECAKSQNPTDIKYIRTAALPTGTDAHEYDFGWVCVMTSGMQAATVIGELWVSYDIELLKPRTGATLQLTAGNTSSIDVFRNITSSYTGTVYCLGGDGTNKTYAYSGSMGSYTQGNKYVIPVSSNAPAGRYMLTCFWNSGGTSNYGTGTFSTTGCLPVNFFNNGAEPFQYSPYPNVNSTTNKSNCTAAFVFDWDRNADAVINFVNFNVQASYQVTLVVRVIPIMIPNAVEFTELAFDFDKSDPEDYQSDSSEEQKEDHKVEPPKYLRKAQVPSQVSPALQALSQASPAMQAALDNPTIDSVQVIDRDKSETSSVSKRKKK